MNNISKYIEDMHDYGEEYEDDLEGYDETEEDPYFEEGLDGVSNNTLD